jgi:hypothetical protein
LAEWLMKGSSTMSDEEQREHAEPEPLTPSFSAAVALREAVGDLLAEIVRVLPESETRKQVVTPGTLGSAWKKM